MGSYCKFCGQRCFVVRVIPDGPKKGWSGCLATCQEGMAHDLKQTGYTHLTAVNPVTDPEAAAAIHGSPPTVYPLGDGWAMYKQAEPATREPFGRDYVCPQCGPDPRGIDVHSDERHTWPPVFRGEHTLTATAGKIEACETCRFDDEAED